MEILTIVNQLDEEFGVVRGRLVVGVVVIGWGNDFGALVVTAAIVNVGQCVCCLGLLGLFMGGDALINHGMGAITSYHA